MPSKSHSQWLRSCVVSLLGLAISITTGCSWFSTSHSADFIPLSPLQKESKLSEDPEGPDKESKQIFEVVQLPGKEGLYQLRLHEEAGDHPPIFLTSMRECGKEKKLEMLPLLRQLFVGLQQVTPYAAHIRSEEGISVLTARVTATLDSEPFFFWVTQGKTESCVIDIVFWSPSRERLFSLPEEDLYQIAKPLMKHSLGDHP